VIQTLRVARERIEVDVSQSPGQSFDPMTVALLRKVLVETEEMLPADSRSSEIRVRLASGILEAAAHGERDPVELRSAGLRMVGSRITIFRRSWLD
jgi:hypothetical protein